MKIQHCVMRRAKQRRRFKEQLLPWQRTQTAFNGCSSHAFRSSQLDLTLCGPSTQLLVGQTKPACGTTVSKNCRPEVQARTTRNPCYRYEVAERRRSCGKGTRRCSLCFQYRYLRSSRYRRLQNNEGTSKLDEIRNDAQRQQTIKIIDDSTGSASVIWTSETWPSIYWLVKKYNSPARTWICPTMVFKRKALHQQWLDEQTPDWIYKVSHKG